MHLFCVVSTSQCFDQSIKHGQKKEIDFSCYVICQVWYRKGINTSDVIPTTQNITGKSWIQMVGRFLLLSVGPNDQVGYTDNIISISK